MADTLVFIPAWNEEANLPGVLDELRAGIAECDVLVVDDGSTDGTAAVAREHGARSSRSGRTAASRRASPPAMPMRTSTGTSTSDASTRTASTRSTSSLASSRSCAPARPTSQSDRGSPRATATRRTATSRRRAGGWARPCFGGRCERRSGARSTTRRAGCTPPVGDGDARRPVHERRSRGRVPPSPARRRPPRRRSPRSHARARERRVQAPREQGRQAGAHRREHAAPVRGLAETAEEDVSVRLIAVLGYSDGTDRRPPPRRRRSPRTGCERDETRRRRPVLGLGARCGPRPRPTSWRRPGRRRRAFASSIAAPARPSATRSASDALRDGSAHTRSSSSPPAGTAAGPQRSSGRPFSGTGTTLRVVTTGETVTPRRGVREIGSWALVPVLALVAVRSR